MNASVSSINHEVLNPDVLSKLPADELERVGQIVDLLSDNELTTDELGTWWKVEERRRAKAAQKPESASGWQGMQDTPTEPLETRVSGDFEAVRTLTRHVIGKLLMGELGAKIFDPENGFSTLECTYLDVREAIESALPLTDAAELKAASVYFSVR